MNVGGTPEPFYGSCFSSEKELGKIPNPFTHAMKLSFTSLKHRRKGWNAGPFRSDGQEGCRFPLLEREISATLRLRPSPSHGK